jgi:hypothetical protein
VQRAKVDKEKAKLSADVDRLRQQLLGLSDQAAARQAAVSLELQRAKLQKELELQVWLCSCDQAMNLYLSAWILQAEARACRSRCVAALRDSCNMMLHVQLHWRIQRLSIGGLLGSNQCNG